MNINFFTYHYWGNIQASDVWIWYKKSLIIITGGFIVLVKTADLKTRQARLANQRQMGVSFMKETHFFNHAGY